MKNENKGCATRNNAALYKSSQKYFTSVRDCKKDNFDEPMSGLLLAAKHIKNEAYSQHPSELIINNFIAEVQKLKNMNGGV